MSLRRWFILLAFILASLGMSFGWLLWLLDARRGFGVALGLLVASQCLEPILTYGLLRFRGWAHSMGVGLYPVKAVCALMFAVGASGGRPIVFVAVGLFYSAFALFLYRNDEFFD